MQDKMYRPEVNGPKNPMKPSMTKPMKPSMTKPMKPSMTKPTRPGMMNKPVYDKNAAKKEALRLMGGNK